MTTKKTCNKETMLKFVLELESGKYKQGKTRLRPTDNTYCCLGVAEKCRIKFSGEGPKRWNRDDYNGKLGIKEPYGVLNVDNLSVYSQKWLGIWGSNPILDIPESLKTSLKNPSYYPLGVTAAQLNDAHGFTFEQIAKCFRHTYIEDVD